ncbi:MAG: hypothetical protein OEV10_08265, partial [Gammaproteobacteria bacterium]|nr:hypothetical protein [Gammaproteobacteria bacterium]
MARQFDVQLSVTGGTGIAGLPVDGHRRDQCYDTKLTRIVPVGPDIGYRQPHRSAALSGLDR